MRPGHRRCSRPASWPRGWPTSGARMGKPRRCPSPPTLRPSWDDPGRPASPSSRPPSPRRSPRPSRLWPPRRSPSPSRSAALRASPITPSTPKPSGRRRRPSASLARRVSSGSGPSGPRWGPAWRRRSTCACHTPCGRRGTPSPAPSFRPRGSRPRYVTGRTRSGPWSTRVRACPAARSGPRPTPSSAPAWRPGASCSSRAMPARRARWRARRTEDSGRRRAPPSCRSRMSGATRARRTVPSPHGWPTSRGRSSPRPRTSPAAAGGVTTMPTRPTGPPSTARTNGGNTCSTDARAGSCSASRGSAASAGPNSIAPVAWPRRDSGWSRLPGGTGS